MQDNTNTEKRQAEALSAALDELNQGMPLENTHEEELAELLRTAQLIKAAVAPPAVPPPAVLNHIVEQAAISIARAKRKKRLVWGVASFAGTVAAAVLLITLLNIFPPATQEQHLAKSPQSIPAPAVETPQPSSIVETPANLTVPPAKDEIQASTPGSQITEPAQPEAEATQAPSVALAVPSPVVPAVEGTMLALADRKADIVSIDAISKTIRQVYHQGDPDEIIITQAPKPTNALRSVPVPPQVQKKMAIPKEAINSNLPNRNKVTVIIDNNEVTLEGATSQEELLRLAKTLTKVSVAR
ncbi:hypothetical protein SPSIL_043890 [Sporomusa silvacetica DSM 10669]|uniref:DUF4367 domain-containing protein n=1 Tax=Sporomusa silvacetica DSM 10669 TaxID=1123289 RepID=A0ABZ3IR35_9FIRM|nr:hypothetical protein [Sporomusa silvacetica]OZC20650.1 hypothetical protein SPSIL_15180 [Sporomusa silvacetica DSM 10669]